MSSKRYHGAWQTILVSKCSIAPRIKQSALCIGHHVQKMQNTYTNMVRATSLVWMRTLRLTMIGEILAFGQYRKRSHKYDYRMHISREIRLRKKDYSVHSAVVTLLRKPLPSSYRMFTPPRKWKVDTRMLPVAR